MEFAKSFNLFGVEGKEIPCITGKGAPTVATQGAVGCLYMNENTGDLYKCTAVTNGTYTWTSDEKTIKETLATHGTSIAELEADLAIERARITNLTTLEEGSTTGDAELTDIRVGFDGTTHATAGEAVRSQVVQALKGSVKYSFLSEQSSFVVSLANTEIAITKDKTARTYTVSNFSRIYFLPFSEGQYICFRLNTTCNNTITFEFPSGDFVIAYIEIPDNALTIKKNVTLWETDVKYKVFSNDEPVDTTNKIVLASFTKTGGILKSAFFDQFETTSILKQHKTKIAEIETEIAEIETEIAEIETEINGCADKSVDYFQKGTSKKTFSKKIAIIAAGQSNIDGRVPYADMPSEIKNAMPITNCHYVKNSVSNAFESLNITGNWAFDLVTYFNICKETNNELYVIKWSEGGTSISPDGDSTSHWSADYEEVIAKGHTSLLRKFEDSIRKHIESNGNNFDIRAFIWHQGEGDRNVPDNYYENLKYMIAYVRGVVGNKNLPLITGTISHNSQQFNQIIEDAQTRLSTEDANFHLIDMSGATLLDPYHFDATSQEYFGKKVYDCLIDIGVVSGEKLNPVKPW